jgi:hypothetical protein
VEGGFILPADRGWRQWTFVSHGFAPPHPGIG